MLHIIISSADVEGTRIHGRFVATLAGRQLCTSREPLLGASRILLAGGVDPETPIAAKHVGADFDTMMSTVGAAAGLAVSEGNTRSATFAPRKAFPVRTLKQSRDGKIETMTARCRSDIPAATTPIRYAVRSDPKSVNPNQEDRYEEIYAPDIGQCADRRRQSFGAAGAKVARLFEPDEYRLRIDAARIIQNNQNVSVVLNLIEMAQAAESDAKRHELSPRSNMN
jgi:hypothetical protein